MRELEGLGVFRTVWRAKVRQREGHVRELDRLLGAVTRQVHTLREEEVHVKLLERLLRTRTRQVHTVREQEVHVQTPERLWASYTVRELGPLLGAVTRQVHTVLLQRSLLKSTTTKRSGIYRNPRIMPMILSMCQS